MLLDRYLFRIIFRTDRPSTTITDLVFASIVVNLWIASMRMFRIFRYNRASRIAYLRRFWEPFCLRESCRQRRRKSLSFAASGFGAS